MPLDDIAERAVHQPIHPELAPRLLPEYAAYHNAYIAHTRPIHELPWNPKCRLGQPVPGGSQPLQVGSIRDFRLTNFIVRVFTPERPRPQGGWPVLIYFHGGGWTLGNIATENAFSTNMCKRASCVVVSVDYRLAPEHKYPAAVDDAVETLHWVRDQGKQELGINPEKIAVGGSSSGANLAAILTHKAALSSPPIPLVFQLLVVPVVDNTAMPDGEKYPSWKENANTVSLVPEKMLWFRDNYLPNKDDWTAWDNSPIFAPEESFKKAPDAWIGVAELDVLRDEGIAYGKKLEEAGAKVTVDLYKGAPHPIMAMDGAFLVSLCS
ncbi:hypothetical protein CERSUDRAFT_110618 [Gelatoporia subvermispora B]|uniref:Alpha/beta hydrolase fold-3 domain-containing protein n=1 Tax=Ceriporiopsis subvermispora (strain B) TaxID=914234 RepID=M2RT14_CERS8|nr:hypothetical protein CERSUDRAFT_110618 [Gelatoporia subvermispora B]